MAGWQRRVVFTSGGKGPIHPLLGGPLQVMCSVTALPPSDSKVFQDYLLPSLSLLPNDVEEAVRVEYAKGVGNLTLRILWET